MPTESLKPDRMELMKAYSKHRASGLTVADMWNVASDMLVVYQPSAKGYGYDSFSPIEKLFWDAYVKHAVYYKLFAIPNGIHILTPQHEIQTSSGTYRVDYAQLQTKVVIELDGFKAHSNTEQIANDRKRQRQIEDLGWSFIRFGGKEIYENAERCVFETMDRILTKAIDNLDAARKQGN